MRAIYLSFLFPLMDIYAVTNNATKDILLCVSVGQMPRSGKSGLSNMHMLTVCTLKRLYQFIPSHPQYTGVPAFPYLDKPGCHFSTLPLVAGTIFNTLRVVFLIHSMTLSVSGAVLSKKIRAATLGLVSMQVVLPVQGHRPMICGGNTPLTLSEKWSPAGVTEVRDHHLSQTLPSPAPSGAPGQFLLLYC